MALNQNQFTISTLKGTKDSGVSVSAEFYSAVSTDTISAGEMVIIASTSAPGVTKVSVGADTDLKVYGVVLTNALKDSWAVGDKLEVGIMGSIVMLEASAAIAAGAAVMYDPATKKVLTKTASHTIAGLALENAAGDGSLVRCLVNTIY
jgi:hypothetical protein